MYFLKKRHLIEFSPHERYKEPGFFRTTQKENKTKATKKQQQQQNLVKSQNEKYGHVYCSRL